MKRICLIIFGTVFCFSAGKALADIVHNDDVIITFSQCVGNDCVNGESFGFDTVRLKENNLRIKFQDTSSTSSFPTNDWQITANDSANGGANKFSIDDIDGARTPFTIEASAPTNSLYIDDGGRLGLGTNIPVADVHVKSGNTPTVRLEQDGSSGFTAQTWDMAGNEANFFIRDATNGSTLPFRIFPGAPSNALNIEASTGDIGLGTTSPDMNLDIEGNGPAFRLTHTGTNASTWDILNNQDTGRLTFSDDPTGARVPFKFGKNSVNNLLRVGIADTGTVDVAGDFALISDGPSLTLTHTGSNASTWDILNNADTGRLTFSDDPSGARVPFKFGKNSVNNLLRVGIVNTSTVSVNGDLAVNGDITATGSITPDYVFQPDYSLPSIEEHARFMWENKHLPKVAAAKETEDGRGLINLGERSQGLLEELEIAHIYIEQLHSRLAALENEQEQLRQAVNLLLEMQMNNEKEHYTSLE